MSLSDREAQDPVVTIMDAVVAIEDGTELRLSWTSEAADWCLLILDRMEGDRLMRTVARTANPESDKRGALRLAATAARRVDVAESTRNNAIRFAAKQGASLREIAEATGLGHMTVKRIIERTAEAG